MLRESGSLKLIDLFRDNRGGQKSHLIETIESVFIQRKLSLHLCQSHDMGKSELGTQTASGLACQVGSPW